MTPPANAGEDSGERVVQPARFSPLPPNKGERVSNPIDFLFDVSLHLSVELGRTDMTVREILDLNIGSVVELNKLAGEPVDILVNGKAVARGEVVVIDENFGVRVIDVLSPSDRLNSLK
jgi:flagellar motor switch protein FliN